MDGLCTSKAILTVSSRDFLNISHWRTKRRPNTIFLVFRTSTTISARAFALQFVGKLQERGYSSLSMVEKRLSSPKSSKSTSTVIPSYYVVRLAGNADRKGQRNDGERHETRLKIMDFEIISYVKIIYLS